MRLSARRLGDVAHANAHAHANATRRRTGSAQRAPPPLAPPLFAGGGSAPALRPAGRGGVPGYRPRVRGAPPSPPPPWLRRPPAPPAAQGPPERTNESVPWMLAPNVAPPLAPAQMLVAQLQDEVAKGNVAIRSSLARPPGGAAAAWPTPPDRAGPRPSGRSWDLPLEIPPQLQLTRHARPPAAPPPIAGGAVAQRHGHLGRGARFADAHRLDERLRRVRADDGRAPGGAGRRQRRDLSQGARRGVCSRWRSRALGSRQPRRPGRCRSGAARRS